MSTARCFSINLSLPSFSCFTSLNKVFNGCSLFSNRNKEGGNNIVVNDSVVDDSLDHYERSDPYSFTNAITLVPSLISDTNSPLLLPILESNEQKYLETNIGLVSEDIVNQITGKTITTIKSETAVEYDIYEGGHENNQSNHNNFIPPVGINDSNTNVVIEIPSVVVHSHVQDLVDNNWAPNWAPVNYSDHQSIFLANGEAIQFQLPIPITNELETQQPMISPILAHQSALLYQEPIFEPIPLNSELTASVYVEGLECLSAGVPTENNSDGLSSPIQTRSSSWGLDDFAVESSPPIQPNLYFSGHAIDPWGAELEPSQNPILEYSNRIYNAFNKAGYDDSHSQVKNEGGERSSYRRTPSNQYIDLNPVFNREVAEVDEVKDPYRTQPQFMTDEEHRQYMKKESEEKKMAESKGDDFFGNLLKGLMEKQTINPQQLFNAISSGDFEGLFSAKPPSPVMVPQCTETRSSRRR